LLLHKQKREYRVAKRCSDVFYQRKDTHLERQKHVDTSTKRIEYVCNTVYRSIYVQKQKISIQSKETNSGKNAIKQIVL
jgi:hypothetical protein